MKNKDIKDINGFKDRIKMLYEYRMVDLSPINNEMTVQVNEDENEQAEQPQTPQPEPVQQPKPVETPAPSIPVQPQPEKDNNTELISFLKIEMEKLENVVNSINKIGSDVEKLGQRMDTVSSNFNELSKAIDEIREPSDIEKLEMRSFDSYPYNKSLTNVWEDKEKSKEEQELYKQGIRKTDGGYEMDYVPTRGMKFNTSNITDKF